MKIILPISLFFFLCFKAQANVLTVCSNTAYPAQYSTIQTAINAAGSGDTIYIYPGTYSETPTFNKKLILIGPGVDPRRPNRLPAIINGNLIINGASASGSVLMGLYFQAALQSGSSNSTEIDNLIVTDCMFAGDNNTFLGNNILLENCILYSTYSTGGSIVFGTYGSVGNVVQNNYIHGFIKLRPGTNTIIRNNIFASSDANTYSFSDIQFGETAGIGVKIQNNIFYKSDPIGPRGVVSQCQFQNNIYYLTSDAPPVNGSSSGNVNTNPLFVNFPVAGAGFSFDYDYHLQAGSPAIGYGIDGKDLGMWGGSEPVNLGFEPPIPRIYSLQVSNSTAPAGGTIQVTIKATRAQ